MNSFIEIAPSMSNREETLNALLEEIAGISDKDYQIRIWIRGEGPECDDFDETVCRYFDEIDKLLNNKQDYNLLQNQFNLLSQFDHEFRAFCHNPPQKQCLPQFFIDTPEWTYITELGSKVLKAFNYKKTPTLLSEPEKKERRRERILKWLFREFKGLSDKEYQRRIWINAAGPEYDDFRESVTRYSSLSATFFKEYNYLEFSDFQFIAFKQFYDEFEKFWRNNNDPALFIDTPKWTKITEMAKDLLTVFQKQTTHAEEKDSLTNKQYAFYEYLRNIHHISDKDYQRKVWIRGEGPECDDFTETVCYNSLISKSIIAKHKDYNISKVQLNIVNNFYVEFKKFWENNDWPPDFIDTPEWTKVIEMAKDVLVAFNFQKQAPHIQIQEPLTDEQKSHILNLILRVIFRIGDKDYQRRVWIRGDGPEIDDFGQTVCYYSGLTDEVFENYKEYGISDIQLPVIKKFHDSFRNFSRDNNWPHLFIDTPEWTEITEMAKDTLQVFNCTKETLHLSIEESMKRNRIRKGILKQFLKDIQKISKKESEQQRWVLSESDDNILGAVDRYFKTIDEVLEDYRNYEISSQRLEVLKKFHVKFEKFWKGKDFPQMYMGSDEWFEITEMAKDLLTAFNYKKEGELTENGTIS